MEIQKNNLIIIFPQLNDSNVGVEMITKKYVIKINSTKQIPRVYQRIILFPLLGKNGIKEPVDMGKKTIIVNKGKFFMMKIKETLNGKPILKFLNMG